jgi:hypothetical protein
MAEVVDEGFEPGQPARIALGILRSFDVAELEPRNSLGLGQRHAALHIVVDGRVDVRPNFVLEFLIEFTPSEDGDRTRPSPLEDAHG